uniref:Uncharacterized protein n=1 Tax=Romanomermis culicivorax TaxID=13658 RepID=A0A915JW95_ROMCU
MMDFITAKPIYRKERPSALWESQKTPQPSSEASEKMNLSSGEGAAAPHPPVSATAMKKKFLSEVNMPCITLRYDLAA